ncbi:MAG TPA: PLP-dependent aminotransferase family protein [Streptosporangiaceae bacterium]|nr:PLP-dependent aminotransferase family protein [Streptosporangiaceae bacterium]
MSVTDVGTDCDLAASALHSSLADPALESMNFLNEIASRYPDAVSFASGRPCEEFFDVSLIHSYIDAYCGYLTDQLGYDRARLNRTLFQYGRTKGIVHELIARHLDIDEGISVDPESIVVTVGFQEAVFTVLRALCADQHDVLLAVAPTYVGLTGAARLAGMPVWPVRSGGLGVDLADLAAQARRARDTGLRARACYVMPDFANPSGISLTVDLRHRLLEVAGQEGLLLLEDNPYGLFHSGPHRPTLKALDTGRQVVYLGSFAKTGFPGARVGYAVADQRVSAADGSVALLADYLSRIKSMVTVNTPAIAQAVVGGKLLMNGCSMIRANERETAAYLSNMRHLLDGLAGRFTAPAGSPAHVSWNAPSGGFFAVVTLPFPADDELMEYSARQHGVLWTPMSHFYAGQGGSHQARLACSQLTSEQIEVGLDRFAALVAERLAA